MVADVLFVNGILFLITVSKGINFLMSQYITTTSGSELKEAMRKVIEIYEGRGMMVTTGMVDMQFAPLLGQLGTPDLNPTTVF